MQRYPEIVGEGVGVVPFPSTNGVAFRSRDTRYAANLYSFVARARRPVSRPGDDAAPQAPTDDPESTRSLLARVRNGDAGAWDRLAQRFVPALKGWARGRVPRQLRRRVDTDDLVQKTFIRVFERIDRIEYLHEGGFFAYLRTVLCNQIRDEIRRADARPEDHSIPDAVEAPQRSPLGDLLGKEILERLDQALDLLTPQQRAAFHSRIEMGMSYQEVADAIGCPSANAARMLVVRAIVRLSEVMDG